MQENYVIEWLRKFFKKPNLKEESLKPVLHFSLLWNLFEHTYFTDQKRLNPRSLKNLADLSHNHLSDSELDIMFKFFKRRYYSSGIFNSKYNDLGFYNNNQSDGEFCKATIKSENPSNQDKTKCVLLIIYRFRNNLFHGRKNPVSLNTYEGPFRNINKFLTHFINATTNDNKINKNRY